MSSLPQPHLQPSRVAPSRPAAAPRPFRLRRAPIFLALRLTRALLVVSGLAGLASVLAPSVFRDPPAYAGNALGTYVVILALALPVAALAMRAAVRGSLRAHFVWLGSLGYLLYAAVLASFSLRFNELFLLYVASLSLGVWSIVALVRCIPAEEIPARVSPRMPRRAIGVYLVATSVAFAALWLADVVPAMLGGDVPRSLQGTTLPTNVVQVLDFGFTLPLAALAGVWLIRRRSLGYLLSGAMLVFLTLEAVSVAVDQWFGHLADPSQSLGAVAIFAAIAVLGAVPALAFLRSVDAPDARG
jgi:Na+-transporting NADH:ubiquinone oxidoreductase subunit NqrE